jgi:ectoine hydroxylase-related dioxygenase (phytanoyl-CoA dioxygenase family)
MMKDPHTGGAFVWHQDYGYWYDNGMLFPDLLTVFIAIDECKRHNGCLQVLKGSHKCGRIEHGLNESKEQRRADPNRVAEVEKVLPLQFVELEPGDAVFFHCNLMHRSEQNSSDRRRWAFLVAYNKATNNPTKKHHHAQYTPLHKVSDEAIALYGTGKYIFDPNNAADKDFMDPRDDETTLVARSHGFH